MTITLTPELSRLIEENLASGIYKTPEEVVEVALTTLTEQEETCAAIAEGFEDALAGRYRPWERSGRGVSQRKRDASSG